MQLIIFELYNEKFGFDLTKMKEINRQLAITPVPNAPSHYMGVANLRGNIVPLINLRQRLHFPESSDNHDSRIIVLELEKELIGFMVDRVLEVIRVDNTKILDFSGNSPILNRDCIIGLLKTDTGIITLLDLEKLI